VSLLEIKNLTLHYETTKGMVQAVDNVSFSLDKGESIGLVGESGCGKSSVAMSIMKLMPSNAVIMEGEILFKDKDILRMDDEGIRQLRWKEISMVFQAAMNALNPVISVGDQIIEAIQAHNQVSEDEAWEKVKALYKLVGLDPGRGKSYPHEYSGGMKQRAIIAMSLACSPDLIIADEPTTALDVIMQDQIIQEIVELQGQLDTAMIYISHDISVIAETCSKTGVMYAGKIVEYAETDSLFYDTLHPYTKALLSSYPSIKGEIKRLNPIPGEPPNLLNPPQGCRFCPRCPESQDICESREPEYLEVNEGHFVACHLVKPTRGRKNR
jgi:peptide/nickel transport system ATP-binding protein